ncbi:MAG TPA: hypothetical protein VMU50_11955 [Polyangia bacterium]|nr:hypothetical protein [Polyangia bacterium]
MTARRRARGLMLTALTPALLSCATAESGSGGGGGGPQAPRSQPDDRDLVALVPAGPETVLEVDLAQLRDSPWSRGLLGARTEEDRRVRATALGYDEIADVDRMVFAVTEDAAGPVVLTVSQGRFVAAAIGKGFASAHPGAVADSWRGSTLWRAGDDAAALLTARTLVAGRLDAVRASIDCGFGLSPDARGGALGTLRRALDPERGRPALLGAVLVTDAVRQRVGDAFQLPEGVRSVGARLDLGGSMDVTLLAMLDRPQQAEAAAGQAQMFLGELRGRTILRVFGLAPLLDGASFQAEGARLRGSLHVPDSARDDLSQKLGIILDTLKRARPH